MHAAYKYKTQDTSKDADRKAKEQKIQAWMKAHNIFVKTLDQYAFEIAKGSWGWMTSSAQRFVKQMLAEADLKIDFTADDLLHV